MKATHFFGVLGAVLWGQAFGLAVSDVSAHPRWPWNSLVDIDFTLSGTSANEFYRFEASFGPAGEADSLKASTFVSEPLCSTDGTYRVTWDFGVDYPGQVFSNQTVRVSVAPLDAADPVYLVIDLSEGKDATHYPHRYTFTPPDLSNDSCRTNQLWFRRCPAGTFTMGLGTEASDQRYPEHTVILTKPFYLGVFELTQGQYFQMEGKWPAFFSNVTHRATRPLEKLSYEGFRGTRTATYWYTDNSSLPNGPLTRFRNKTGFATADLPTEAQWEFACRAGTTGKYYLPEITDSNSVLKNYGRNNVNKSTDGVNGDTLPDVGGTAKVGSFPPNPWGFYDMYGNVGELCGNGNRYAKASDMDVNDFLGKTFIDPRSGPNAADNNHTGAFSMRGGRWKSTNMYSAFWQRVAGSIGGGSSEDTGIRICITCE